MITNTRVTFPYNTLVVYSKKTEHYLHVPCSYVDHPARCRLSIPSPIPLKVFARDADVGMNGDLDYSIRTGKGKKGRFKIHPKTGQVYSNKAFPPSKTFDLMVSVNIPQNSRVKSDPMLRSLPLTQARIIITG